MGGKLWRGLFNGDYSQAGTTSIETNREAAKSAKEDAKEFK